MTQIVGSGNGMTHTGNYCTVEDLAEGTHGTKAELDMDMDTDSAPTEVVEEDDNLIALNGGVKRAPAEHSEPEGTSAVGNLQNCTGMHNLEAAAEKHMDLSSPVDMGDFQEVDNEGIHRNYYMDMKTEHHNYPLLNTTKKNCS